MVLVYTETASSSSISIDNSSVDRANSGQSDEEDTTVSDLSASQFDYVAVWSGDPLETGDTPNDDIYLACNLMV